MKPNGKQNKDIEIKTRNKRKLNLISFHYYVIGWEKSSMK